MAIAATKTTSLVALMLPGTPYSTQMARFYIRTALGYHDLGDFAENVEMVTSELISNAITHAGASTVGLELMRLNDSGAIVIVVTDSSPQPPAKRELTDVAEHGRGLHVVEALSTVWGWTPRDPGKAVFAMFTKVA
jgi:anti-sigma regulatory factor (Ser/Thr protein kinase)